MSSTTLSEFEIQLPSPPKPAGCYIPVFRDGLWVMTSGMLPIREGVVAYTGHVTDDQLSTGQAAAGLAVLNALAVIRAELGDLSSVERIIKLTGFVQAESGFTQHPAVMNGASELLVECFGEFGKHTRSAIGVASLPLNAMVELELLVKVKP